MVCCGVLCHITMSTYLSWGEMRLKSGGSTWHRPVSQPPLHHSCFLRACCSPVQHRLLGKTAIRWQFYGGGHGKGGHAWTAAAVFLPLAVARLDDQRMRRCRAAVDSPAVAWWRLLARACSRGAGGRWAEELD